MMMLRLWWTTGDADDQMLAILNQADANNSRLRQKHSLDDSDGDDNNDDDGDDDDDDDNDYDDEDDEDDNDDDI